MGVSLNKRLFVRTLLLISTGKTSREEHLALWTVLCTQVLQLVPGGPFTGQAHSALWGRQRAACGIELTWCNTRTVPLWKIQRGHLSAMHFPASRRSSLDIPSSSTTLT